MLPHTDKEILVELADLQATYHQVAEVLSTAERHAYTAEIQALRAKLSALFTAGAKPCPVCGVPPFGMRKNRNEIEIGCLGCRPEVLDVVEGIQREPRVRAETRAEAVTMWNAGLRLVRKDPNA